MGLCCRNVSRERRNYSCEYLSYADSHYLSIPTRMRKRFLAETVCNFASSKRMNTKVRSQEEYGFLYCRIVPIQRLITRFNKNLINSIFRVWLHYASEEMANRSLARLSNVPSHLFTEKLVTNLQ